jgi:hypothetical protein
LELSASSETASLETSNGFSKILWKPKVHYSIYKSSRLAPFLGPINSAHTIRFYLSNIYLNTAPFETPCIINPLASRSS